MIYLVELEDEKSVYSCFYALSQSIDKNNNTLFDIAHILIAFTLLDIHAYNCFFSQLYIDARRFNSSVPLNSIVP